jgi:uncharacterized protein DUF5677
MDSNSPDPREAASDGALKLLDELREAFNARLPLATLFEASSAIGVVLARLWRCARLFDAIVLLLREKLPEEAAILCRPMFEDSLKLREMGETPEQLEGLAVRLTQDSLTEKSNLLKKLGKLPGRSNAAEQAEKLAQQQRELDQYRREKGVKAIPEFLSAEAALKRFRHGDLWFYLVSHQYVHGTEVAMAHLVRRTDQDMRFLGRTDDPQLIVLVAAIASLSLVEAAHGAFALNKWNGADELAAIQDRLQPMIDAVS